MHDTAPVPAIISTVACAERGIAVARRRAILATMRGHIDELRADRAEFYALSPGERRVAHGGYQSAALDLSCRLRSLHLARGYLKGTPYRAMEARSGTEPSVVGIARALGATGTMPIAEVEAVRAQVQAWLQA